MPIENATPPTDPATAAGTDPTPTPSADEQALAALDEGFAEAAPAPAEPVAPAAAATEPTPPAETPVGGQPPGTATKEPTPPAAEKPEPNAATEKEIGELGLKGKAAERFQSMANEIRELAPLKEALEKAGIKDVAELPQVVQRAQQGAELFQQIQQAGVNPEQYGMLLDYGSAITRAMAGDVKAAEACWTMMQSEMAAVARMLGKEVPGIHDPLAEHPDLKQLVEDEEMPRDKALETARLRNTTAASEARRQADSSRQSQEAQQQAAVSQATADLDTLGRELAAIDPHYAAKAPVLLAQLRALMDDLPADKWVAKARQLYATIPAPAPAPAPAPPAKVMPGPMRGSALHQHVMPQTDDPAEAMEQAFLR